MGAWQSPQSVNQVQIMPPWSPQARRPHRLSLDTKVGICSAWGEQEAEGAPADPCRALPALTGLGVRLEPGGREELPSSLKKGRCLSQGTGTPPPCAHCPRLSEAVQLPLANADPDRAPAGTGALHHLLWPPRPPQTSQSRSLGKAEALLGAGPDTVVQQRHLRPDLGSGL